jgi:two-component system, LytTR family, sensor kinase
MTAPHAAAPPPPATDAAAPAPRPVLRTAALLVAGWLVVGAFNASRPYLAARYGGPPPDVRELWLHLYDVLLWALFTPAIVALARRFPLERRRAWRSAAAHVAAGAAVAVAGGAANYPVIRALFPERATGLVQTVVQQLHFNFQWYWIILGVGHAVAYYEAVRERELAASRLEAQLSRVQLEALKMQIQPHFLFNTLNAVSELVYVDPRLAERTILRLADLLRLAVYSAGAHEVPLRQELAFLHAYLSIQQTRFRDRLSVEMEVEPDAMDAMAPVFLLQPLVENALRHGVPPDGGVQRVRVAVERRGGSLVLEVTDNGPGLPEGAAARGSGVGLANTRARLAQLYGAEGSFELGSAPGGGARVRARIPWRAAPAAADQAPPPWEGGHTLETAGDGRLTRADRG